MEWILIADEYSARRHLTQDLIAEADRTGEWIEFGSNLFGNVTLHAHLQKGVGKEHIVETVEQ